MLADGLIDRLDLTIQAHIRKLVSLGRLLLKVVELVFAEAYVVASARDNLIDVDRGVGESVRRGGDLLPVLDERLFFKRVTPLSYQA